MEVLGETRVGLRFRKGDAARLRALVQRGHAGELSGGHVSLFEGAAKAAMTGEPLIIRCAKHLEAVLIAQGFVNYGIHPPAIEDLNGSGN